MDHVSFSRSTPDTDVTEPLDPRAHERRSTMFGLVYRGPGLFAWEECPSPVLQDATDALVRITTTTICGTDLHIVAGDVHTVASGRILGHEGVGIVEEIGSDVHDVRVGDRVVIGIISSCGRCPACRRDMASHCERGGWRLGHHIDGTQAEFVRVPFADRGLFRLPRSVSDEEAVLLSCILPTGLECGTSCGHVAVGDTVAIVGAGPVGLACLLTTRLRSPASVILVDFDVHRLDVARDLGASETINDVGGDALERIMALTGGRGVDVAIEAVGNAAAFDLCQAIIAPGGRIANMGVHSGPVSLHLERLWSSNITLSTRLVDASTIPLLLELVRSGQLVVTGLVSHRFGLADVARAYDVFRHASAHGALKVVLTAGLAASTASSPTAT